MEGLEDEADLAVAVVDGARMKTPELLSRILEQFGYNVVLNSTDELLNMLNVFVVQQARSRQAPVLVLENINEMFPSALGALCKLASLKANSRYALRLVLTSNRDIGRIIQSPSMSSIAERVIGNYELGPMTSQEALRYLYAKLRSGGVDRPDDIFSVDVCEKLHALSGGLPGDLDAMALSISSSSALVMPPMADRTTACRLPVWACNSEATCLKQLASATLVPPNLCTNHPDSLPCAFTLVTIQL